MNISNFLSVILAAWLYAFSANAAIPQIATSDSHTLALKADGSLWAWGDNARGYLGDGTTITRTSPVLIGTGFKKISAGAYSSFAIRADGTLWAWGANGGGTTDSAGLLGDGTTVDRWVPTLIGDGFAEVVANWYATVALKRDGSLWTWGKYPMAALLASDTSVILSPRQIGSGFAKIASSQAHVLALKTDGTLWAWGSNTAGQLGDGTLNNRSAPTYIDGGYKEITAGEDFSLGIKNDGSLWAWGWHGYGQLGLGPIGTIKDSNASATTFSVLRPAKVGDDFVAVTTGSFHTHAIKSDGSLWGWGLGVYGALGDGMETDSDGTVHIVSYPKKIGTGFWKLTNGGGNNNGFALKTDGSLWAWGSNYQGMLGDGTTQDRLSPISLGFNVYSSSGLAADVTDMGPAARKTLYASIAPNSQDAGMLACAFVAATLPDGASLAVLGEDGWNIHRQGAFAPYACGAAAALDIGLAVDADLTALSNTVVYLGYGLGQTPTESFEDMLKRSLWKRIYAVP